MPAPLPRRQALALLAAAAWAAPLRAASGPAGASQPAAGAPAAATRYDPDGPARVRPLAVRSSLLDITQAGARLVAVGERGHVLLSDDQGKTWRQARSVPTRSTLTAVAAVGARQLWATAHGGLVLASADAGDTWTVAAGQADRPEVLLAVHMAADGHGLAVGGFGTALATRDAGRSWQPQTLVEGEAGERHLNRIVPTPAGTWLVAAEGGLVLRGTGQGAERRFTAVKTPYAGSLWCGVALPGGTVVLGGMRGNLVTSSDDGQTWRHLPQADAGSLTGATLLPDGRPLLVGVDGTVLLGDAAGSRFQLSRLPDRSTLTGAVALPGGPVVAASAAGPQALKLPT